MFKYLLLVLLVSELHGWEIPSIGRRFGEQLEPFNSQDVEVTNFSENYFLSQKLNHFDSANDRKWHQRYFVNEQYYKSDGPIFLMIGDMNWGSYNSLYSGAWLNYAEQSGALCVFLEHRYFGTSWPTDCNGFWVAAASAVTADVSSMKHPQEACNHSSTSSDHAPRMSRSTMDETSAATPRCHDVSTTNLRYLSSQQVLGDIAEFIYFFNDVFDIDKDTKWIAFGGGYAGSFAAWLRLKYPHLVHGAVSSSAPFQTAVEYPGFFTFVEEKLRNHSSECVSEVRDSFAYLNKLLEDPTGLQTAKKILNLCSPSEDLDNYFYNKADLNYLLASLFAGSAFTIDPKKSLFPPINVTCNIMTNSTLKDPLSRLSALLETVIGTSCLVYDVAADIDFLKNTDWVLNWKYGGRQRLYRDCTEFGIFQTPDQPTYVFGNSFPLEFFKAKCYYVFSPEYNWESFILTAELAESTYGGTNIDVTNVAFVQGSEDPFHSLGVVKDLNPTAPAILIKGARKCEDMKADSPKDTPELKAAREKIAKYLETLLKN